MDLKVHINDIHGSQMAAKINGNFTLNNHEFRFTAIAFGRIGGQNVGAKLSQITETELKKLGYDVDEVIMKLQQNHANSYDFLLNFQFWPRLRREIYPCQDK